MSRLAELLIRLREYLFPHEAEKDESFRQEICRRSRRSLYVMGVIIVLMSIVVYPTIAVLIPVNLGPPQFIGLGIAIGLLGGLLFSLARRRLGLRHGRLLALLIAWLACVFGVVFDVSLDPEAGFTDKDEAELPKLERVREQLQTSAGEAVDRLDDFVHRVQRFTNLDRGEVREVNVRDLIDDVVALIDRDKRPEVDLHVAASSLPSIVGKPQQLTAVLSRVIPEHLT